MPQVFEGRFYAVRPHKKRIFFFFLRGDSKEKKDNIKDNIS